MRKKSERGHISVKGTTYWAFKEACEHRRMGPVLEELIVEFLDGKEAPAPEVSPEQLLAAFHHTFMAPTPPPEPEFDDGSSIFTF